MTTDRVKSVPKLVECLCMAAFGLLLAAGCDAAKQSQPQSLGTSPPATGQPPAKQPEVAPRRVLLLAAASTADAVQEVAKLFEQQTGATVEISTGASNALAQQIIAGAPADIFLSANEKWADEVKKQGLSSEVRPLLGNRLVMVVPRGNPAGVKLPADLMTEKVQKVALAGESVPAGIYADQALRSLDFWEKLTEADKIVRGQDVRVTLGYVEQGEVEAGIVYATDARISDRVEVAYVFDPSIHDPLVYPAVLLKRDNPNSAGRELYEFLFSKEAALVFQRHGFLPPDQPTAQGAP